MAKVIDITGQRFGKLIVVSLSEVKNSNARWNCLCDCGKTKVITGSHLKNNTTKSCGCISLKKDLTGQVFGRLKVLGISERRKNMTYWLCRCDCGNEKYISRGLLIDGQTKSCGCLNIEMIIKRSTTHGLTKNNKVPVEYTIWSSMITRCTNPKSKAFKYYGERGITYCERWKKYENFIEDMGERPSTKHSIERIDNNKGYCKENCKWGTVTEQANNRRSSLNIIVNGVKINTKQYALDNNIKYATLVWRYNHNKPLLLNQQRHQNPAQPQP